MSVITHRSSPESRAFGRPERSQAFVEATATASDLSFARLNAKRRFWRRAWALARRAWGPLIIYSILAIALVAAVAIRVMVWVPQDWR